MCPRYTLKVHFEVLRREKAVNYCYGFDVSNKLHGDCARCDDWAWCKVVFTRMINVYQTAVAWRDYSRLSGTGSYLVGEKKNEHKWRSNRTPVSTKEVQILCNLKLVFCQTSNRIHKAWKCIPILFPNEVKTAVYIFFHLPWLRWYMLNADNYRHFLLITIKWFYYRS